MFNQIHRLQRFPVNYSHHRYSICYNNRSIIQALVQPLFILFVSIVHCAYYANGDYFTSLHSILFHVGFCNEIPIACTTCEGPFYCCHVLPHIHLCSLYQTALNSLPIFSYANEMQWWRNGNETVFKSKKRIYAYKFIYTEIEITCIRTGDNFNREPEMLKERERTSIWSFDTSFIVLTCKLSKVHVQSKLVHCTHTHPHTKEWELSL